MKKQTRNKIVFKDFQKNDLDTRQFKSSTGSPILYKKYKRHKRIYYPFSKHHATIRPKPQHSHKHAAVVYSRTYGREVYSNIDIWPDDDESRKRLFEKLKEISLSEEYDNDDDGIDIPKGLTDNKEEQVYKR